MNKNFIEYINLELKSIVADNYFGLKDEDVSFLQNFLIIEAMNELEKDN
jgi:hypothetical protein